MARQGLSQVALAERLGWPQARLSRRISDGKHTPIPFDVAELNAVATALGVQISQFLPVAAPAAT
jgi:transcriptional regulator with XRE-family HTH domain